MGEVVDTTIKTVIQVEPIKVDKEIKTDVEGFEQQLLDGAINTIKEQKPILLISIYHNYHDFYKIKPWLESLNLGYKFNFFKGCDGHPSAEILLIGEVY